MEVKECFLRLYQEFSQQIPTESENPSGKNEIEWDKPIEELGFNSFLYVKFLIEVEKILQITLPDEIYVYEGEVTMEQLACKIEDLTK